MAVDTAVIGAGEVSDSHLSALAGNPRTNLVGICDIDESRATAAAKKYDTDPYFDLDDLLESVDLDWIHVCTSVQTHLPLAEKAIRAGVPVLIEKPTTETVAELDELAALSEEHDVPVSPVHQHLFDPAMRTARKRIRSGEIGPVRGVDLVYTGHTRPDEANRGTWVFDLPGGEFEEGLPHPLYLTLGAGGYPRGEDDISAQTSLYGDYEGRFDYDSAQIQYATEEGALCSATMLAGGAQNRTIQIHGEDATLIVDMILQTVHRIEGDYKGSTVGKVKQSLKYAGGHLAGLAKNAKLVAHASYSDEWAPKTKIDPHKYQIDRTAYALQHDLSMPVPLSEARWTIRLMEELREAAERPAAIAMTD
ncbi:Gfo/Idh/MocA family protein [Halalkalicoccus jeotgali]|uniref:Oxidoreductase domain protein n=1 Tax=Halalkalicoccus jeotgali (strain DSM 18796 / CECT 7217 / JCM 14584 / KCTC 4019 / B3) TaxID=795797 RepID=D8J471_HALJB|nr:Gfo/Idh/MocA family oxidoreductase [Halalkalicoccus jeotgali]ADJ15463.1 oxidoreductase domain protein [Halalkalicoccus jeotgali B3]ELY36128.1 oxidoreductase domain-containing protein [Halalkalicoccus jeotgali B3]